jgi:hypothetical protein
MQCRSCGAQLAPEATACPRCGRPTPYNAPVPGAYDRTVVAPPPQLPPTVYGSSSAGPASPYGTPPYAPPPSAPYRMPQASPSSAQQYPYGPPYGTPPSAPYPAPPVSPPPDGTNKRRRRLIALVVGFVALVLVLSGVFLIPGPLHPLPPPGPSGSPIVPAAAAIVTNVQVASAVDSYYHPTQLTSTVAVGETLYITFDLHLNGRTGYVQAKFYRDREFIDQTDPLMVTPGVLNAAVYASFPAAIQNGTAELYWCQQADCSDRQLVAVAHFTITAASSHLAAPGQLVTMVFLTGRDHSRELL